MFSVANGSSLLQQLRQYTCPMSTLPWRFDAEMGTANSLHAVA